MKLKKLLFVTLGSLIMGLGISITIGVNLGSDPMTLFWIGIADQLHITVGQANILVCVVLLAIVFFLDRHQIHVGSLINPAAIAIVTDNVSLSFLASLPFAARILMMIAGLAVLAFGIALQIMEKALMKRWCLPFANAVIWPSVLSAPAVIFCWQLPASCWELRRPSELYWPFFVWEAASRSLSKC